MTETDSIDVSVVIGFKDWGLDRLRLAIESLRVSFGELRGEVIVSDYGSRDCPEARAVVEEAGGRHVYTETDGIWSRSRALNAGIAASTGRVVVSTDADMLFSPRAMEVIGRRVMEDPSEALVLQCRDLPSGMGSDWVTEHGAQWQTFAESSTLRPRWGMGGMMAVSRETFLDVRGFDERMQIYGGEDLDFAQRVRRAGRRVSWVEDPAVRMYHMWHPSSRTAASETPEGLAAIEYNRDILLNDRSVVRNTTRWRHRPPDAPPVATVVIATRNRASLLHESIHSTLAQTVRDIEVLVVDDSSEDDTRAVVEGIRDPRLRYLESPRRGIAAARNFAATQSRARYTVVHDDDDMMMPDRIEHHLATLEAGDSGTYGGWVDFDDSTGEVVAVNRGKPYSLAALLFTDRVYAHATLMLETRLIREVAYDERFRSGSDYNLAVRLARLGVSMRHTGQVHLVRRLHTGQVTHHDSSTQQSAGRWTTAAALGLLPGDRQASVRAATRELSPVDIGLDDEAVAKLIQPYLPDRLVARDLHVVLDEDVDPGNLPGLTEAVAVEDLLHEDRADLVCGVLRSVSWADLAAVSGRGKWGVLRCRPRRGKPAAAVPVEPVEHLRRLSLHMLESLPTAKGAFVVGHSDLVDREDSCLLGHWRIGEQETYLVAMPAGQELVDALRQAGEHEIRMIKPAFSPRTGKKTAGNQPVHRVLKAPAKPRPGGAGKKKERGGAAAPDRSTSRRGEGRQAGRGDRDARPPAGGRKGSARGSGSGAPPVADRPRPRLFTRRRVLVAGMSSSAVLGGAAVGLVVGGVAAAVAVAAGLWLAVATGTLLVLLLRALDTVRRVEETEQSSTRRLRTVVETQAGRTLREARQARVKEREHTDTQHRQLAADITRQVNEQTRAETKRVTSAVLSGVSDSAKSNAESIGRLITQLRDRVAPLESLAGLDARMTSAHAGLRDDLRVVATDVARRQDDALNRATRQAAESASAQDARLRRLATDHEQQIREAEHRLVDAITSRLSEDHRGETRRAVTELLDGLTRATHADADRVTEQVLAGVREATERTSTTVGEAAAGLGERVAGLEPRLAGLDRQVTAVHEDLRGQVESSAMSSTEQVLAGVREATERTSTTVGEAAAGLGERVAGLEGPLSAIDQRVLESQQQQEELGRTTRGLPGVVEQRTRLHLMRHLEQVQALVNLFQVLPARSAAPQLGGWAAAPDVMLRVLDELLTRRPKLVVECGSGASTVWLAMVAREFGLPSRVVALEHDAHFAESTRRQLERHDVTAHAEVRVAELSEVTGLPDHPTPWYDVAAVEDLTDIGLLFVDGPPGDTGKLARLPAVPVLQEQLADDCTIVLDDAHRPEEQAVAEQWREMLGDFDYEVLAGDKGAAVLTRGARS